MKGGGKKIKKKKFNFKKKKKKKNLKPKKKRINLKKKKKKTNSRQCQLDLIKYQKSAAKDFY